MTGPQSGEESIRPKLVLCVRDTNMTKGFSRRTGSFLTLERGFIKSENKRETDRQTETP